MRFDIKLTPDAPRRIGLVDRHVEEEMRLIAQAREQGLRDLAAPYLRTGYLPSELAAVERQSKWFEPPDYTFASVEILCKRSALRLWCRRVMMRCHLRAAPFDSGGLPWRG
jgi:hypothetical protein